MSYEPANKRRLLLIYSESFPPNSDTDGNLQDPRHNAVVCHVTVMLPLEKHVFRDGEGYTLATDLQTSGGCF